MVPVPEPHPIASYQQMLQSNFQDKFMCAQEGWAEDKQCLADIYTELYITAGYDVHINTQHEVWQIEKVWKPAEPEKPIRPTDMFKHPSGKYRPIKTVMTNGIAGIGKTFLVQKFVLDWAEQRSNQDVHLIFPFTFRQLNPLKGEKFSLAELIHECIPETVGIPQEALNYIFTDVQSSGITNYDKSKFKLLFVFDGLDESRLHLDLHSEDIRSVDDLRQSGIDFSEASVCSGVFTEIFKEDRGRKGKDKMFSFVHLSVQEFLAALYVRMSLNNSNINVMPLPQPSMRNFQLLLSKTSSKKIHRISIDRALQSPNGHLDLFLRFLLGLSLQTNQDKLQDLLMKIDSSSETTQKTVQYIKKKISENVSAERSINLFHCLNELKDCSLVEEIQQYLSSGRLSTDILTPAQWSALGFILLSSEEDLDVFDLKKYSPSEEALLRLLPVVKASKKVLAGMQGATA
ncbi:NACHT, LRR and PYD domains-containing protein 3-like [Pundamilia nyererei]|uniref:NACHT, LRR and PYD domains-containing protein 3-like n=1 Tax=Pundamilia nyererei TaxID=303518 RepID=A0A9Y3RVB9_9CICH|nr:PREDICTED: NACHT, LRR and PYD domains-containing protein 3-like [Pundamilia nyererei]